MSYRDWEEDPRNRRGRHSAPDSWVAGDETHAGQPRGDGGRERSSRYGDPAGTERAGGSGSATYGSGTPFDGGAPTRGWSVPDRLDDTASWTRAAYTGEFRRPDDGWPARPEPEPAPPVPFADPPYGDSASGYDGRRRAADPREVEPFGYQPRPRARRALPSAEPPPPAAPTSSGAYAGELLPPGASARSTAPAQRDRFGSTSADPTYRSASRAGSGYPEPGRPSPQARTGQGGSSTAWATEQTSSPYRDAPSYRDLSGPRSDARPAGGRVGRRDELDQTSYWRWEDGGEDIRRDVPDDDVPGSSRRGRAAYRRSGRDRFSEPTDGGYQPVPAYRDEPRFRDERRYGEEPGFRDEPAYRDIPPYQDRPAPSYRDGGYPEVPAQRAAPARRALPSRPAPEPAAYAGEPSGRAGSLDVPTYRDGISGRAEPSYLDALEDESWPGRGSAVRYRNSAAGEGLAAYRTGAEDYRRRSRAALPAGPSPDDGGRRTATVAQRGGPSVYDVDEDDDEFDDDPEPGGYLASMVYTAMWYAVPMVLWVLWSLTLNSQASANCIDDAGVPCASERTEALATLTHAMPRLGGTLLLSLLFALVLRWVSSSWKAATVGFAAAVVGGGLATVGISVITGQPIG